MNFLDLEELSEEEKLLKNEVHRFAEEVVRPASIELDRMPAEDRIKPGSPFFKVMKQMKKLGYHKIMVPPQKGGIAMTPLQRCIIFEELGWGSLGFATALGVDMIPFTVAALFGSDQAYQDLVVPWLEGDNYYGCWGVTEPEHGSDYLIAIREEREVVERMGRGNVVAEKDGDEWIISGQKSAWVSSAPVATHCGLHAQVKGEKSIVNGLFCIVPLNSRGVRKGKPAEMLGMRDNPQGELFFDCVRIPEHYVIVAPGLLRYFLRSASLSYELRGGCILCWTCQGSIRRGVEIREHRIQGGVQLVKHKNIKLKLYEMFEKIETARAYVRRATEYTHRKILELGTNDASPRHARAAQIYAKKIAFEVANDALQIFGAYGLSKEFIIEKFFRDARALQIEDGTVEVLSLEAGEDVIENYEKNYYDAGYINKFYC